MVMFFEKPSLRTRLTFEAGMSSLGGTAMFVDQSQSRLDAREKLSDIAHNLERWVDVIVLRTFAQETIEGMARYASVPVINALSDLEHPCQALADYFTLQERFGDLKKITPGVCRRRQQCGALADADLRVPRIVDPNRDAEGLRLQSADRGRCAEDCEADGRADRIADRSACGGRGRRRGLYRRLGQHGAGTRIRAARGDFSAVPGESQN